MNVVYRHSAIQAHISGILKDCKFFRRDNASVSCGLGQELVPLLNVSAHYKSAAILIQLIKAVCNLLPVGLDRKVGLSKSDHLFARISVLDDQIAGITRQFVIGNRFSRCTCLYDFPDLRKIVRDAATAVLAGDHGTLDDLIEIFPFCVVQHRSELSRCPVFRSVRSSPFDVFKALILFCK